MANKIIQMSKLKRAFQMLAANIPQREICGQLHMGRGVLARYKKTADENNISYANASAMLLEDLDKYFQSSKSQPSPTHQRKILDGLLSDYVSDLQHNRYLTIQKLHEKYKKAYPEGYGYTQFKKAIS